MPATRLSQMIPIRSATVIVSIVLPIVAIASVGLRFVARKARKLPFLADDWVCLVALITTVLACVINIYGVMAKGVGLGPKELPPSEAEAAFKVFYAIMLLFYFTQGATKVSAILFLRRIFTAASFRIAANVVIALVSGWTMILFIIQALNSWKIPGFWNMHLLDYGKFTLTMAILDLVFDMTILILPLPIIKKLHMDSGRKYALAGIFALGSIAVIASTFRIYYCHENMGLYTHGETDEWITFVNNSNSLWLAVEANLSIIAICLPTLSAFLKSRSLKSRNPLYVFRAYTEWTSPMHKDREPEDDEADLVSPTAAKRAWLPLRDLSANITSIEATDTDEPHGRSMCPGGINVERTFASTIEKVRTTDFLPRNL